MVAMFAGGNKYEVTGKGFDPTVGRIRLAGKREDASGDLCVRSLLLAALLCCNATLVKERDETTGEDTWQPEKGSSPSEAPILVAARKAGFDEDTTKEYRRVLEVPFLACRRMMLTL